MGEQFRVELPALYDYAGFAGGQAEQTPGPEDLAGKPVFGWGDQPGAHALAQHQYRMWRGTRRLANDVTGGLHACESGLRTVVGNYEGADERGRQELEKTDAGLRGWDPSQGPDQQGQQGQPNQQGHGRTGYGQEQPSQQNQQGQPQPTASPSGTEPSGTEPSRVGGY